MRRIARLIGCSVAAATALQGQGTERVMRLSQDLRVSGAENDITALSNSAFVVFPDGAMAIFDETSVRVVFFDATGTQYATLGRKGAGPGEFAGQPGTQISPTGVARGMLSFFLTAGLISADTAWMYDRVQRRFTVFTKSAKVVHTSLLPPLDPKSFVSFTPLAYYGDGRVLGEHVTGSSVTYTEPDGDKGTWWRRSDSGIVIATPDGRIDKRVATLPVNRRAITISRPGVYSSTYVPFETGPLRDIAQAGDRFLYVTHDYTSPTGGTYRVTVIGVRGDTLLTRVYPFTSPTITKRRSDSAYAAEEKQLKSSRRDPSVTAEILRIIRDNIPPVEPPFESAMLGADNTIWLRLPSRTTQSYLVLDPSGNAIGIVTIPGERRAYVKEATRSAVWVLQRDTDGFMDIVRYRISS